MKRAYLSLLSLICLTACTPSHAQSTSAPPPHLWFYDHNDPGTYVIEMDFMPDPERGACFYLNPRYQGHHFCVASGQRIKSLPQGFGNKICSIRSVGGGETMIFWKPNFAGNRAKVWSEEDISENGTGSLRGWNYRINSIVVR